MDHFKYIIIGGGAAGTAAAESIRLKDARGTIAILNEEPYTLYSRVMLSKPNFFLGQVPFEQVYLKNEEWYKKLSITYFGSCQAVDLNVTEQIVKTADGRAFQYDKLLIATGVQARRLTIPGSDKKGIHYLRTLEDGKGIMAHIKTAKRCVVVGGGFIGFEMADLAKLAGMETTMLLRESYFWEPTLDPIAGGMVGVALEKGGIVLKKNVELAEILGGESVEGILLKDGSRVECDMIIAGIGITTPIEWIRNDGAKTNTGILCDEFMQTSLANVYAAGDIAEYKDLLLEETVQMGSWVNAHEQGRIAGLNMVGPDKTPFRFVSFYTTQGLGISIAFVGDARPLSDRQFVSRGSAELGWFERFVILGKELEGATLINKTGDLTTIAKIIEKNIDVTGVLDKLADPNFNLKELLPK